MAHTTDRLLAGLKRRGVVPTYQSLLSDADVLAIADDLTQSRVVPTILSCREDYFIRQEEIDVVSGQREYDIPKRAIGRALREIKIVSSGDQSGAKRRLTRVAIEDEHYFRNSSIPQGFYLRGDKVALLPTPATDGLVLELWYAEQLSSYVATSQAAQVESVSTGTVTCSAVPSAIATGSVIDFIQGVQGNSILGRDVSVSSVSGSQITFNETDVPTGLAAGDWISIAQTTPVLQIPDEAYSYLESLLCQRILKTLGDVEGSTALDEAIKADEKALLVVLQPRVQGEPQKIINRSGLLRGVRSRFRYGFLWGR